MLACCCFVHVCHFASFSAGNFHQSRDSPPPTAHDTGETEDAAFGSVSENVVPVSRSTVESADSQSDSDPSEGAPIPAAPSQPLLLEDPLVLNTPRVSIPKKHDAAFKRNKWPQLAKFPSVSRNLFSNKSLLNVIKGVMVTVLKKCKSAAVCLLCDSFVVPYRDLLCFPLRQESVIYLKKWFLRKNHKGLFVDGIHRYVFLEILEKNKSLL